MSRASRPGSTFFEIEIAITTVVHQQGVANEKPEKKIISAFFFLLHTKKMKGSEELM